jgi:hypothetical protein
MTLVGSYPSRPAAAAIRAAAWGAVAIAAAGLSACVTYPTSAPEPIPLGDGVYTIAVEPEGTGDGLHSGAYQRAIRFCFDQGRQLLRLDGQPGAAQQVGTGMRFRCVGPGEPGWKQPVG